MTRKQPQHPEPGSEAAEPSPGDVEKAFLREVRRNLEVDAEDDLEGPKAMADRSKRKGRSDHD